MGYYENWLISILILTACLLVWLIRISLWIGLGMALIYAPYYCYITVYV